MLFAPLTKITQCPDGSMLVGGYASTRDVDSDGEVIPDEVIKAALPDYLKFPTIRTMHRPNPVGKTVYVKQDSKGTFIEGRVYDEDTKKLIKGGVLRAFSIGGGVIERDNKNPKVIRKIRLSEISLVDSPANKQCEITMWKRGKEPRLDRNIICKIQSRKPQLFSDIMRKSRDVSSEPRDKNGEWTAGGNSIPSNGKGVILEDRGQRRGRPWGTVAGAVGVGLLGAAVAARNPSRLAAILAGAAAHGVAGGIKGAARGAMAEGASWPVRTALAAGNGIVGAGVGALHGMGRAEARPRLYNAIGGAALAAGVGATVGGAVGETAGGMWDRAISYRVVDKSETTADLIKICTTTKARIAALARGKIANPKPPKPQVRTAAFAPDAGAPVAKAAQVHPLVALARFATPLAKYSDTQPRDSSGQFAAVAGAAAAVAGGLIGDALAGHAARGLSGKAQIAARVAGGIVGELAGEHAYHAGASLFGHSGVPGADAATARASHENHDRMVEHIKNSLRNPVSA